MYMGILTDIKLAAFRWWTDVATQWMIYIIIGLWGLWAIFINVGKYIETNKFPVLTEVYVSDITNKGNFLCWTIHYTKVRDIASIDFGVTMLDKSANSYLLSVFDPTTKLPYIIDRSIKPGIYDRPYCAYLADGLINNGPYIVKEYYSYNGLFGLWKIDEIVPDFVTQ